jgi:hypothetical protein
MKSARCSCLLLALLAPVLAPGRLPASPAVSVGSTVGVPGITVPVPVNFTTDTNVPSLQFDLHYATNYLAPGAPVGGSALADQQIYYTNGVLPGVYRVLMFSFSNSPLTNGVLVYVPFGIATNAPDHDELLSLSNVVLSNPQGYAVPANASGGVLAIATPPRFRSIVRANGGLIHLELLGASGRTYVLQAATNLPPPQWTAIQTNLATNGVRDFDDSSSAGAPMRFYRAMVVP